MGDQVKPVIITSDELEDFLSHNTDITKVDLYDGQVAELLRIDNPSGETGDTAPEPESVNIFYPLPRTLIRCVSDANLFRLRTNRNRELITTQEQNKLAGAVVGVAGMSVGSGIALGMVYSGISRTIKIADRDVVDTSNLNRLRVGLKDVGRPKVDVAAQAIYEIDPFADVRIFGDGITAGNIDEFFTDPKLDVVVDEIDDFKMKVMLRVKAKEYAVPLLMLTSLGDNILIDIERYDTDPETRPFNGLLHDDGQEILDNPDIDAAAIRRYSVEVVGAEYIPTRALQSVAQMGRTLVGRPQLYTTIAIDSGLAGFIVREILLGVEVKSGRYFLKFSDIIKLEYSDLENSEERQAVMLKLMGG